MRILLFETQFGKDLVLWCIIDCLISLASTPMILVLFFVFCFFSGYYVNYLFVKACYLFTENWKNK